MSNVPAHQRRTSSVEFDNTYFKIYADCILITRNNFSPRNNELKTEYAEYISCMKEKVLETVCDIGKNIRIANSIYPIPDTATFQSDYETRRKHQNIAIGLCFDLLTKYQLVMKTLQVPDNKYVNEIKNIMHEINCLKAWRSSDKKRYKH